MTVPSRRRRLVGRIAAVALFLSLPALARAGTILSDNLSNTPYDTESITGDSQLAAAFGTDKSAYSLDSVTLLLQRTSIAGSIEVQIYDDGGLQPGSLLGTLSGSTDVSTSLSEVTFSASGIYLAANATYWVVVTAMTGAFNWSWTLDDSGSGVGFQGLWASYNTGDGFWFPYTNDPLQFRVSASAVPEPGSIVPFACGAAMTGVIAARRRRTPKADLE